MGLCGTTDANPGRQVPYLSNNGIVSDAVTTNGVPLPAAVIEEALAAFYGEDPRGSWTLRVSDDSSGNGGSLGQLGDRARDAAGGAGLHDDVDHELDAGHPGGFSRGDHVVHRRRRRRHTRSVASGLQTFITHTAPGDLDITLTSPTGTVMTLTTDNGGSNLNVFNGTQWDDKADPGHQVPFTGDTFTASRLVTDTAFANGTLKTTLVPEEAFGAFQGENPNGTWTLRSSDDAAGGTGTLSSWTLEITTTACPLSCVVSCDDGNPCTDDSCSPATGCVNTNNTASCDDGNVCTTADTCSGGTCVGGPAPDCSDGNVCTDDACIPATGCVTTNNTASCSDGNACTTADTCAGGLCVGGPAPNCNDGNVCTNDSCNTSTGCVNTNNTASCSDGNACTTADTCAGGTLRRRPGAELQRRQRLHERLVQHVDGLRQHEQHRVLQ